MKIRKSARAISRSMWIGIATITSTALVAGTLVAVPAHPLLPVTAVAQAQEQQQEAPFAIAEGQLIDLSLFTDSVNTADRDAFLTALEAIRAEAEYPGNETDSANIDLTLLEGIDVTVGAISLPLLDLLNIQGPIGALGATASTPAGNQAYAAAGVLTDGGAIDLGAASSGGGVETVLDLSDLLAPQLTDGIIDELSLRVGAASASAAREGDQVTSEYALANVDLTLDSPLVADITDVLIGEDPDNPGIGVQVDNLVAGLAGNTGLLSGLLDVLEPVFSLLRVASLGLIDIGTPVVTLDSTIQETLVALLDGPLTSSSNALTLDLSTGEVIIDLEALGGTSAVDPNTNLLDEEAIAQISTELDAILTDIVGQVRTAVFDALLETAVTVDIDVEAVGPLASINIDGTLNEILNGENVASISLIGLDLPGINGTLQGLLGTVGNTLELALTDVVDGVLNVLLENTLPDLVAPLTSNLSTILSNQDILEITLNDQPNPQIRDQITRDNLDRPNEATAPITRPDEAFTVSALRVNILNGAVDLPLARATVNADADWVVAPTLDEIADQTVTLGDAITPITPVVTPDTATVTVEGLPAGVTYNDTTNTISGTPTAVGTSQVTVTAITTGGTATQTFTITVDPAPITAPEIAPIDDQTGTVDTPITPIDVEVTPDTAEVAVEGLPDGVTYNGATGQITGIPTTAGDTNVTVTATNEGETATEEFTFTIVEDEPDVEAPTIGAIADQDITLGDAIAPITLVVTPDEVDIAVAGLPDGVTYNNDTGVISGTPTIDGAFNVTVTATNDAGTDTEQFTLTVTDPDEEPGVIAPTIGEIDDQTGTVDTPITPIDVEVTPDTAEVTVEGLPDGLTYDEDTGEITGTPTEVGVSTVTVTAVNDGRTVTETFTITITERDDSGNGSGGDGSSDNGSGPGSSNGSGNGSSDNGNGNGGIDNGSSEFLQQCLSSPAGGLVGLLAALGAVSAIAGPALEPLLKSIGAAVDQQLRQLSAATAGAHQPAWVQTINRGLNDAANAVNHQMVSNALFATAALALVSSPILCDTDGDSGSSAGSSIGSS